MLGPSPAHPGGVTKVVASWREAGLDAAAAVHRIDTTRWDDPRPLQALQALRALLALTAHLARRRADVVLLHASTGGSTLRKLAAASVCRLLRTPYVVEIHSGDHEAWASRSRIARVATRALLRRSSAAIVTSSRWEPFARSLGAPAVAVIPNALSSAERAALAPPDPPPPPPATPTLLFLGRFAPVKGPDRIAAALAAHPPSRPFRLRFFGNGDRAYLERALAPLPAEAWHVGGFIGLEAKAAELASATALVVPSRAEGFGQVLIEARAAGTPVIASDVGAVADVLDGYPRSLLVPAGDDDALGAALHRTIAGDWPPAATSRSPDLPDRFHAERAVATLVETLAAACARPGPQP